MARVLHSEWFRRLDAAEVRFCRVCNRAGDRRPLLAVFRAASRLGDGVIWYALMLALPLVAGRAGLTLAVMMLGTAMAGTLLYWWLKNRLVRRRPFVSYRRVIRPGTRPLDEFSFPSGHTLHAASFTTLALLHMPVLGLALLPFAAAVAASRVVLGLHYPSDVVAGGALGIALALLASQIAIQVGALPLI